MSELALALLDGTVFEIVQGLLEIQHLTEKNLYSQRRQLHSEHRGTGATVGVVLGHWGHRRGEHRGEGLTALEGTQGVDSSGEMGVALQGSVPPCGGETGLGRLWGGGKVRGILGWNGVGTPGRQLGEGSGGLGVALEGNRGELCGD